MKRTLLHFKSISAMRCDDDSSSASAPPPASMTDHASVCTSLDPTSTADCAAVPASTDHSTTCSTDVASSPRVPVRTRWRPQRRSQSTTLAAPTTVAQNELHEVPLLPEEFETPSPGKKRTRDGDASPSAEPALSMSARAALATHFEVMTTDDDDSVQVLEHIVQKHDALEHQHNDEAEVRGEELRGSTQTQLSNEQQFILDLVVEHKRSIFLTGGGGTGKSYLLREIISNLDKRSTFVTAPTGIAALNLGGVTIHSFAGIGLGEGTKKELLAKVRGNRTASESWKKCRVLIIDEVSMLPPALLDALEFIARQVRGRREPFGGIQLVLCGDFLQLPPVSRHRGRRRGAEDPCEFCFVSKAWQRINPRIFVLRTTFRQQTDVAFATVLNELRLGQLSAESIHVMMSVSHQTRAVFVGSRMGNAEAPPRVDPVGAATEAISLVDAQGAASSDRLDGKTVLRATNHVVNNINNMRFQELSSSIFTYHAITVGPRPNMLDSCPAEATVALRVGARVMLLKNMDQQLGLVNGSIGIVTQFIDGSQVSQQQLNPPSAFEWLKKIAVDHTVPQFPVVRFQVRRYNARRKQVEPVELDLVVQPQSWTATSGGVELAARWQIPIKLAWAITIHKSQGMTLDDVNVDFDGMFEDAQAYVALSRCTTLQGLTVENFDLRKVRTNLNALAFYEQLEGNIAAAGGDHSMYQLPLCAENPWGPTQEDDAFSDDNDGDATSGFPLTHPAARGSTGGVTESMVGFKQIIERLQKTLASAIIERSQNETMVLSQPHAVTVDNRFTVSQTGASQQRRMVDLVVRMSVVENCYVIVDTCSWMALHEQSAATSGLRRLCDANFVRVPQMVLAELDGLTKRQQPQVAFAARKARGLITALLGEGLIELQASHHAADPATVFAIGGDGTRHGTSDDTETRRDNPILCFAAYLNRVFHTAVVVCTEDCMLGLRANACGFSCCSAVNGC